jgi:hypothetical protein
LKSETETRNSRPTALKLRVRTKNYLILAPSH